MKVLLLDTAFAAQPLYDFLLSGDHEVWVMGNREGDVLAKRAGSRWIKQDYSQLAEVEACVKSLNIERIVPGCTDTSIEIALQLSAMGNRGDSADTYFKLGNKDAFRKMCQLLDLPAPRVFEPVDFPMTGTFICKPVDAYSGRGITVFDGQSREELDAAVATANEASPSSAMVIEIFADGQLYSCSAFVEDQKITDSFYVFEGSSVNPYAVDTSFLVTGISQEHSEFLEESLNRLCHSLMLVDGLLHTQFILTDSGPVIVEVSRRCPGDLYPLLVEYSTGFEYAARYASFFIGEPHPTANRHAKSIIRHTVTSDTKGVYSGLVPKTAIDTHAFFPLVSMGADLLPRQGNRAGILFCETENMNDLHTLFDCFMNRLAYDVT